MSRETASYQKEASGITQPVCCIIPLPNKNRGMLKRFKVGLAFFDVGRDPFFGIFALEEDLL